MHGLSIERPCTDMFYTLIELIIWIRGRRARGKTMSEYTDVLKTTDIKDGEMKEVNAAGQGILIARVGGDYFAVSSRCPHMGAKLAGGTLKGRIVTCPRHGSQFDLSDGSVVRWTKWSGVIASVGKLLKAPRPLATYRVRIEGDRVQVEV